MSSQLLPAIGDVVRLLEGLLGRDVSAKPGTDSPIGADASTVVAIYRDDEGEIGGLFVCDIALACHAGAALSMIPASAAADAVKSGGVPENIMENLREVLNIASQLFNGQGGTHQALKDVLQSSYADLPEDVSPLVDSPAQRLDATLDIGGYGAGQVAILMP